jgi:very-short-patch-repair endonuclease
MAIFNDKEQKQFRRDLRNNASRGEVVLWSGLRKNGVGAKFRRQESIFKFVVDFYCPELGLAVEVDGVHHENTVDYDNHRDSILESIGVRLLRFKDSEVIGNSELVLDKIRKIVAEMRETTGSYRRPSTQLHPDEKNRRTVGRSSDETKPPPSPRLGKAGEPSTRVREATNTFDNNKTF